MLADFKRDADGGIIVYVQSKTPGADKESNWLPAPNGRAASLLAEGRGREWHLEESAASQEGAVILVGFIHDYYRLYAGGQLTFKRITFRGHNSIL